MEGKPQLRSRDDRTKVCLRKKTLICVKNQSEPLHLKVQLSQFTVRAPSAGELITNIYRLR